MSTSRGPHAPAPRASGAERTLGGANVTRPSRSRSRHHHRSSSRNGRGRHAPAPHREEDTELAEAYSRQLHSQPRRVLTEPQLLYVTPILDQRKYVQPLCYMPLLFPCCMDNEYRRAYCRKRDGSGGDVGAEDDLFPFGDDTVDEVTAARRRGNFPHRRVSDAGEMMGENHADDDDDDDEVLVPAWRDYAGGGCNTTENPLTTPPTAQSARDRSDDDDNTGGRECGNVVPSSRSQPHRQRRNGDSDEFDDNDFVIRSPAHGRDGAAVYYPHHSNGPPPGSYQDGCWHLMFRCFCVRCSIAQQTDLLFREEERRQRYPYRFCCETFFGEKGYYGRTLATILLCDLFTGGLFLPCGLWYQGLGTALYGWRIRYLLRCRYGIYDIAIFDLLRMLCLPMMSVDQQGTEMMAHDLFETPALCYHSQMQ